MTIEERIEVLERELAASRRSTRRLWICLGLSGLVFVLVWGFTATTGSAQAQGAAKVIRANTFIVEDENGETRAVLDADTPSLTLFDKNGIGRAVLGIFEDESTAIRRERHAPRRFVRVLTGGPMLTLYDEKGETRARLDADKGGPGLGLSDQNGKLRAELGTGQTTTPDGTTITHPESSLRLFKPDGEVIWSAP